MENISNALLMAAGVMLAVLTIGIAVFLFRSGSAVATAYQKTNEENELNMFNTNFTRMLTGNGDLKDNNTITIYDIITVSNFAWNTNCEYVDNPLLPEYTNDPRMLRIFIQDQSGGEIISDLQNYNQRAYDEIVKAGYYYDNPAVSTTPEVLYYTIEVKYNSVGRIHEVTFKPKGTYGSFAKTQLNNKIAEKLIKTNAAYKRTVH